jgi:hypothetical protein
MIRARKIINLGLAVLAISALIVYMPGAEPGSDPNNTGMADPEAFANAFDCYLAGLRGSHSVTIPLVSLRGFGGESQNASGNVQISVNSGAVLSTIRGLPANGNFDLWLVENRPITRANYSG